MGDVAQVWRAGLDDWPAVRAVRLTALGDARAALGSTLPRELAFDEAEWQRRVGGGNWFLAELRGEPVGVVAGTGEDERDDARHLVAMWVAPEHRGTGVGVGLVEAVCT